MKGVPYTETHPYSIKISRGGYLPNTTKYRRHIVVVLDEYGKTFESRTFVDPHKAAQWALSWGLPVPAGHDLDVKEALSLIIRTAEGARES